MAKRLTRRTSVLGHPPMPPGTTDSQPTAYGEDPIVDEVLARLSQAASPGQMERLVGLAMRMVLRRDEDREQLDRLSRSIQDSMEQARQRTSPGEFAQELHRIAQECAKLLQAAHKSRLSRTVLLPPTERARKEENAERAAPPPKPSRRLPAAALIAGLVAFCFLPAAAIAIDPSLAPASWRSAPAVRLTPAWLAAEIAAAGEGGISALAERGITVHVARLIDDRPLVMIDNLPRRLCPATGLLLARQGDVTLFGQPAPDNRASTIASLCHRETGDARLYWSPGRGD